MLVCVKCLLILAFIQITISQDYFDDVFEHNLRNSSFNSLEDEFPQIVHGRRPFGPRQFGLQYGFNPAIHFVSSDGGQSSAEVLRDLKLQKELQHFNIERIPERVVHAKGSSAFGYFRVTDDKISQYCKATLFEHVGKTTKIAVRFSQAAISNLGTPDTVFGDMRGFAIKFYTEEGIWDLVGNNVPIFPVRDPEQFISFIHANKRNPQTGLFDMNTVWDFNSFRPETLNLITYLFSDFLIPASYRHMPGFHINAHKLVNHKNEYVFAKFNWFPKEGVDNLDPYTAEILRGYDPDYYRRDLFVAIAEGNYPEWTLKFQIMTQSEADNLEFNPFDATKFWPEDRFPMYDIGVLTLNQNPSNFFAENEQLAFCPANLVPGIEPSPDRLLHGRLFSYSDTQRYRLGVNHHLIPVNHAKNPVITPTQRDGRMRVDHNYGPLDNYYPNSFSAVHDNPIYIESPELLNKSVIYRFDTKNDHNYFQARQMYYSLPKGYRKALHRNLAIALKQVYEFIRERMLKQFEKVDVNYARAVRNQLKKLMSL